MQQDPKLETQEEPKVPFFARFLEGPEYPQVQTDVKAGRPPIVTMKYPSDDDEWPTS